MSRYSYHKSDNSVDVFSFITPVIPESDRDAVLEMISHQPDRDFLAQVLGLTPVEDEPKVTLVKPVSKIVRDPSDTFCRVHNIEMRRRIDPDGRPHGHRCMKCESDKRRILRQRKAGKGV